MKLVECLVHFPSFRCAIPRLLFYDCWLRWCVKTLESGTEAAPPADGAGPARRNQRAQGRIFDVLQPPRPPTAVCCRPLFSQVEVIEAPLVHCTHHSLQENNMVGRKNVEKMPVDRCECLCV